MSGCDYCDRPGSLKTYKHQVCLPINGRVRSIDNCIHQIVAALNAGGVGTTASCYGHGKIDGTIFLNDGRLLLVINDANELRSEHGALIATRAGVAINGPVDWEN